MLWRAWSERRRAPRLSAKNVTAKIDGRTYNVIDWSAHGLALAGYNSLLEMGDILAMSVNYDDCELFEIDLMVSRYDPKTGKLGGVYVNHDHETELMLQQLFRALLISARGKKVSAS
jgi:hypothetical protein